MQSSVLFYILYSYTRDRRRPEKIKIKVIVEPDKTFITRREKGIIIDCPPFSIIQDDHINYYKKHNIYPHIGQNKYE